jgi:hypothetical protein
MKIIVLTDVARGDLGAIATLLSALNCNAEEMTALTSNLKKSGDDLEGMVRDAQNP